MAHGLRPQVAASREHPYRGMVGMAYQVPAGAALVASQGVPLQRRSTSPSSQGASRFVPPSGAREPRAWRWISSDSLLSAPARPRPCERARRLSTPTAGRQQLRLTSSTARHRRPGRFFGACRVSDPDEICHVAAILSDRAPVVRRTQSASRGLQISACRAGALICPQAVGVPAARAWAPDSAIQSGDSATVLPVESAAQHRVPAAYRTVLGAVPAALLAPEAPCLRVGRPRVHPGRHEVLPLCETWSLPDPERCARMITRHSSLPILRPGFASSFLRRIDGRCEGGKGLHRARTRPMAARVLRIDNARPPSRAKRSGPGH